jgi:hypothetical protein
MELKYIPNKIYTMQKENIKTLLDVDAYRYSHIENGCIDSRYHTLVKLYGERIADTMLRELKVRSWNMKLKK